MSDTVILSGLGSAWEVVGKTKGVGQVSSGAEQGSDSRCGRLLGKQWIRKGTSTGIQERGCPTTRMGISGTKWNRSVISVCNFAS